MQKNSPEWIFHFHHSTPERFARTLYRHHKSNSKKRNHPPPTYTRDQFVAWCINQPLFHQLYDAWIQANMLKSLYPSVDRIDNHQPYSFFNIRLVTWAANHSKYSQESMMASPQSKQPFRKVRRLHPDGTFKDFPSINMAGRSIGRPNGGNICRAIKEGKTAGGFRWQYI